MNPASEHARPSVLTGPGRLIVLSGPSGVGKDTVLQEVFKLDASLRRSVSYTTRPARPGEHDGSPYTFVDETRFREMIARGEFLEWADVYGHLYGTSLERVRAALERGDDIVLKIDVQGAASVRDQVGNDAVYVFLLPPSLDVLRQRLLDRDTEDPASLERRYANAVTELAEKDSYDHLVVNDDVERAAREIVSILRRHRG